MKNFKILFIPLLLFLTSCYDNVIYFDIENQSINTCYERAISRLYIESEDYIESFRFAKISGMKGCNIFNLTKINSGYSLEIDSRIVDTNSFQLRKNTKYNVFNDSNGDAASGRLSFKTDNEGKVIWASKTSCK